MEKGKLIPLGLAAVLLIVAIGIFINNWRNNKAFDKLVVSYKTQKSEYNDIRVDDVIVVGDVSFWVVSTIKDAIVLNSSGYMIENEKEALEFEIKLNESKQICFKYDDCIIFNLM